MLTMTRNKLFLWTLLLCLPLCLYAQAGGRKTMALVPFWGSDQDIIDSFGDELFHSIDNSRGYRPMPVDMINLPDDVPEGGFPPYICPSPSLTKEAEYAITGDLVFSEDDYEWRLMVYLWLMEDRRLLYSDMLYAYDQEDCSEKMPYMVTELLKWIPEDAPPPPPPVASGPSRVVYFTATEPLKRFYLGARVGAGARIYSLPFDELEIEYISAALFASMTFPNIALVHKFGLQAEGIFSYGKTTFPDPYDKEMSIMLPLLLRWNAYRDGPMAITALGGPYVKLPIGNDFYYRENLGESNWGLGWTAGINFGNKIGPGFVFLDVRYLHDLNKTYYTVGTGRSPESINRHMVSVSIGYEIGFLKPFYTEEE